MQLVFRYSIVLLPLCIACVLFGVLGFKGYYGQDSHEYLRFASAWKASGLQQDAVADFHGPLTYPLAGIQNKVYNLYLERYEIFESGALLGYNPEEFTEQWSNTNVGFNWKKLNTRYTTTHLWKLDNLPHLLSTSP